MRRMDAVERTGRTRLDRNQRREQTRERLLDAASEVFARRGYSAASLDDVAQAAGYTKGAVYSNFASKADLFMALIERRIAAQAAPEALRDATLDQMVADLERHAGASESFDPGWLQLATEFWTSAMRDEQVRKAVAEQYERARAITAGVLDEKFREAGVEPPMPPRDLAIVAEALGIGLGFQHALDPNAVPLRLQAEVILRLLGRRAAAGG
jgi:AcrR family transcriptional regulator